ncbi:MAG: hypothetical protein PHS68_07165, partial [Candidatus Izemoplasmatales bacterium]|nr:hypothetical protein [Candidatus Izemoplasmatales bacterium]
RCISNVGSHNYRAYFDEFSVPFHQYSNDGKKDIGHPTGVSIISRKSIDPDSFLSQVGIQFFGDSFRRGKFKPLIQK